MKKLFTFVVIYVYCVQQSYFAASNELTDNEIKTIRTGLEGMPEMETNEIEQIVSYLENNRENANRLLAIAMQGDTCTVNAIDLKRIAAIALNVTENELNPDHDLTAEIKYFTDEQLELIETDLKRSQTPEKVQRSMKILRIVRNGLINNEKYGPGTVDLYKSAAKALSKGCPADSSFFLFYAFSS